MTDREKSKVLRKQLQRCNRRGRELAREMELSSDKIGKLRKAMRKAKR